MANICHFCFRSYVRNGFISLAAVEEKEEVEAPASILLFFHLFPSVKKEGGGRHSPFSSSLFRGAAVFLGSLYLQFPLKALLSALLSANWRKNSSDGMTTKDFCRLCAAGAGQKK